MARDHPLARLQKDLAEWRGPASPLGRAQSLQAAFSAAFMGSIDAAEPVIAHRDIILPFVDERAASFATRIKEW
jgi:hypothetical protein